MHTNHTLVTCMFGKINEYEIFCMGTFEVSFTGTIQSAACGFSPEQWGITLGWIAIRYENQAEDDWSAQLKYDFLHCFIWINSSVLYRKGLRQEHTRLGSPDTVTEKIKPHTCSHVSYSLWIVEERFVPCGFPWCEPCGAGTGDPENKRYKERNCHKGWSVPESSQTALPHSQAASVGSISASLNSLTLANAASCLF